MFKHLLLIGIFILGMVTQVQAGAGGFFGISYVFGSSLGGFGVTAKILSDDDPNTGVIGAGVSFFPYAEEKKFGADLSAGYLFENVAVTGGWDFLQRKPLLAVGYVNTEDDGTTPVAPPTPTPE